jgi:hypothetical protein
MGRCVHQMRRSSPLGLAIAIVLFFAALPARGDLIPIVFGPDAPVVFGANGTLSYDAGSQVFHAETAPIAFTAPFASGGFAFVDNGNSIIDLKVDNNGAFAANGSGVSITGSIDIDGDGDYDVVGTTANPLLTGTVNAFGADLAGPPTRSFDGLFDITGGLLTQQITLTGGGQVFGGFPVGQTGGFILSAEDVAAGILGNFAQSFSSSSVKVNVGVAVPEPSSAVLALVGAAVLLRVKRKRAA